MKVLIYNIGFRYTDFIMLGKEIKKKKRMDTLLTFVFLGLLHLGELGITALATQKSSTEVLLVGG